MDLSGKTVLVTGSGRGIGKGCALALARAGATVVINDRPGSTDLSETVEEIQLLGRTCFAVEGDVFSRAGCEKLVSEAITAAGPLDVLVSNPAYSRRATFLEYPVDDFEKTINGTLTSGFHMSQLVARHLVERGQGGRILFISSVQAEMPIGMCAPYGAAKAGLNHLMRTIAVELAPHRINVNAISPGWIDTPGEHEMFDDKTIAEAAARLPWGRLGRPDEVGRVAAFLASDDADYITGVVLPIDGLWRYKDCLDEIQTESNDTQSG